MPLARVVAFEGVSSDRMAEMQRDMQSNERPRMCQPRRSSFFTIRKPRSPW
jgi:hypothetical protein